LTGKALGWGWDEAVEHAMKVVKGRFTSINPRAAKNIDTDQRVLRMVANVQRSQNTFMASNTSVQGLDLQDLSEITKIIMLGWSRGAITSHMMANALFQDPSTCHIRVSIFAVDPVPGPGNFSKDKVSLPSNVDEFFGIYASDDRERLFTAVLPDLEAVKKYKCLSMPGNHSTVASAGQATASGKVVRHYAEKFIRKNGVILNNCLNLTDPQILKEYDDMLANASYYSGLHDKPTVTRFPVDRRYVAQGSAWTSGGTNDLPVKYTNLRNAGNIFINWHHEKLFRKWHPMISNMLDSHAQGMTKDPDHVLDRWQKVVAPYYPKTWAKIETYMCSAV
jgi:hypothetical protein